MILIHLFIAFLIPGVIGFGGGPGSIALINDQVTSNFKFMTVNEFNQLLSISNSLPGPIATKLAIGVGFIKSGYLGAFVCLVAITLPSAVAVIMLYSVLVKNKNDYRVKRVSKFIMPVVIVLFVNLTYKFFIQSFTGLYHLGISKNMAIFQGIFLLLISFIALSKLKLHPLILIIIAMLYGYFII